MGNPNSGLSESEKKELHREDEYYEDEINLIDYFLVLGRHKLLIILGSLLPALAVGLFFYLSPRDYKLTYCYDVGGQKIKTSDRDRDDYYSRDRDDYYSRDRDDYYSRDRDDYYVGSWDLDSKNFQVLLNRFYSDRNIGQIINGLKEEKLTKYSEKIGQASNKSREKIQKFIDFEVSPSFIDLSQLKQADPEKLKTIKQMKADLLWMTITSNDKDSIRKAASVIRSNLEDVIPVYIIEEQLKTDVRKFRRKMAEIEADKFQQNIRLETNRGILKKLKSIENSEPEPETGKGNVKLEFSIGGKSEYLPLENQVQAVESRIIELEEEISASTRKYEYYQNVIALNDEIISKLQNNSSSAYTVHQFCSFLDGLVDTQENEDVKNYLTSFAKKIDNRISSSTPVTEQPKRAIVAKGTVKKAGITFAVAFLLSVFAAFLKEGLQQNEVRK